MSEKIQDVINRFRQPSPSASSLRDMDILWVRAARFAFDIVRKIPEGHEQALALMKLEEAVMWANAGIVRHQTETDRETEEADDMPMPCVHDKVYSPTMLVSYPPQMPWICRKCGEQGIRISSGHPGFMDEYEATVQQFQRKEGQDGGN